MAEKLLIRLAVTEVIIIIAVFHAKYWGSCQPESTTLCVNNEMDNAAECSALTQIS